MSPEGGNKGSSLSTTPGKVNNALSQCCQDDSVAALAVDWVTSNLYWSSIKKPDLHVTSRSGHTAALLHASPMVVEDPPLSSALLLCVPSIMTRVHTPSGHYLRCRAPPLRVAVLHSSDGRWEEPGGGGLLLDGRAEQRCAVDQEQPAWLSVLFQRGSGDLLG